MTRPEYAQGQARTRLWCRYMVSQKVGDGWVRRTCLVTPKPGMAYCGNHARKMGIQ